MAKVTEFKYFESTVQRNGGIEVKKIVQAGCSAWRRVTGVICDRRASARKKGGVYKTVVGQPCCMETVIEEKTGGRVGRTRIEDAFFFWSDEARQI